MRAVILAAGCGRKVFPYDLTRQKAAMPVGATTVIRWTVECLQAAGVTDITVVVGHLHERVRHALLGLDVRFVHQARQEGTAPATLAALAEIGEQEPFLVMYGDCLLDREGIAAFCRTVTEDAPLAAAMVSPLGGLDSLSWLCAEIDGQGRLTKTSGHPRGASHRLCGVYAFSPQAIPYIRANPGFVDKVNVGGMPPHEAELAQSVQLILDAGHEVRAVEHTGLFVDIDKPWHVLLANHLFAEYCCRRLTESQIAADAQIHDGAEISGFVRMAPGSRIGNRVVVKGNVILEPGAKLENGAIIGGDCIIARGATCKDYCAVSGNSVVGPGALVAHGAELGGVLFEGAYLYHYCEMAGVFGARHDVGAATVCGTLRFDDLTTTHNVLGRKEQPEFEANVAYFGDYTRTGVNAIIMPGVKVGAYSCIGPGVVQYEDVAHNTLVLVKQETIQKPWGPERYGW